jgi:hypothetical protein
VRAFASAKAALRCMALVHALGQSNHWAEDGRWQGISHARRCVVG